jgi:hypothetical protein
MSMTSREIWAPLAAGSHNARVVVRTASGEEVDVKSVRCCAQMCVIETDERIMSCVQTDREILTPEELNELLDAHTASVEECAKMLGELQYRGIDNLEQLAAQLALAENAE